MVTAMTHSVSAREANQRFSEILGRAAQGEAVVITRRGEPVAQLMPYNAATISAEQDAAWDRLTALLEHGLRLGGDAFDRDALYER
jgi:prevent-host-death family protein